MISAQAKDFSEARAAFLRLNNNKKTVNAWRKILRDEARPMGQQALQEGGSAMPRKGGLAARIMAGKVGVSVTASGVTVKLTTAQGDKLTAEENGMIRHPVFARGTQTRKQWAWVNQRVTPHRFLTVFEERGPQVADKIMAATIDAIKGELKK